jgi:hypothetical protein
MENLFRDASRNGNGSSEYVVRTMGKTLNLEDSEKVELVVEKNIPIPPHGRHKGKSAMDHPMVVILMELGEGESIHIPAKLVSTVRNAMQSIAKYHRKNKLPKVVFVTRTDPLDRREVKRRAFRIWRRHK